VSILAALDFNGFVAWRTTPGTFTRGSFHKAFVEAIVPLLNPWPLPRSIIVLDNAKIHMYPEFEKVRYDFACHIMPILYNALFQVVHMTGARLLFLPPYSPHLNPIEFAFGRLKAWIQKNANLVFPLYPELVLRAAMPNCCVETGFLSVFAHCGYAPSVLRAQAFERNA